MLALRKVMWVAGVGAFAVGCGALTTTGCPDADADGLCDVDDPCPDDPGGDADGDGLCGAADLCPEGPDTEDQDDDGIPDACDPCPRLPGGDADGDGVCDANDPCPETADTTCEDAVFIGLQVDGFPSESSWTLRDGSGGTLARGDFARPGAGVTLREDLPVDGFYCLSLTDEGRNGGIRGRVFSRRRSLVFAEWDFYDWNTQVESFCFDLTSDGERRDTLPVEAEFLAETTFCTVQLTFTAGVYAEEHAWVLERGGRRMAGWQGSWATNPQYDIADEGLTFDERFELVEGNYVVRMVDRYGDGWQGNTAAPDNAEMVVRVEGVERARDHLTAAECGGRQPCERDLPFTVSCR